MYQETPINCPNCGQKVSTHEAESGMYRSEDVKCPKCGYTVIHVPKILC